MRLFTVFTVFLVVAAFSIGCASSSDSDATAVPAKAPEQTITPEPAVLTHELEVIVKPNETAVVLLNPKPIGDRTYVHGRTVTIDVLPQPGWEVADWLGPVFDVAGRTAKIDMTVSHSVIVSLVQSSASRPTQTPIFGRAGNPLPTIARPLSSPTSAPTPVELLAHPVPCLAIARAAYSEGKAFDSQGEYERAIEKMDEVIRLDPQCAAAYSGRGFATLHIGRNQEALRDYNEAIRLAPDAPDLYNSYYNRGLVYSDLGQHRQAIQDFNEAIRLFPGQGWLYDGRATVYDRMGDEQSARNDRDQACRFHVDRAYCDAIKRPTPTFVPTRTLTPTQNPTPFPTPTLIPTPTAVSTFNVTKTADTYDGNCDADCSLREATTAAGPGATIRIPAGVYTLEIEELTISKDLTISGTGPEKTIIQAANSPETAGHGVFDIERKNIVSISGVTIRHGNSPFGGGITNDGTLTLIDSSVIANFAENGGGIHNTGTLRLINTVVSSNTAAQYGGGVYNDGALTLQDSLISDNVAVRSYGGGIYHHRSDRSLTITKSTISGNDAHYGGGINGSRWTIADSTVSGNTSRSNGGGIHGSGILINSVLSGNTAREDGGGLAGAGRLTNVTISGNIAGQRGGGIFSDSNPLILTNSTMTLNESGVDGGGIYSDEGAIDLTPLLVSEASRVQLPLQHTPLATCLSTSCGV